MNFDISHLLEEWDYHPGQVIARRFIGEDGRDKVQLRVDLGILQMNAKGRPDGKRPFGCPSAFDYYIGKLSQHIRENQGSTDEFWIRPEDATKLQMEALQYHHRSICFMQLEDYPAVVRDTERVLKIFDMVAEHANSEELAWSLQQFRPQVLMLNTRARATQKLLVEDYGGAIEIIEDALQEFRDFYEASEREEGAEQSAELQSLEHWLAEVSRKRPLSKRERLELDLDEAVEKEDYERAARVRDALRNLPAKD